LAVTLWRSSFTPFIRSTFSASPICSSDQMPRIPAVRLWASAIARNNPCESCRVRRMRYETTCVRAASGRLRAPSPDEGTALPRRLYLAPLPDPAGQRPRAAPLPDRRRPRLLCPDRARRHQRLCCRGPGLPDRQVQSPQDRPRRLAQGPRRGPARPAASVPPLFRQADQPVDAPSGGRGLLREGLDSPRAQRRGHPPGAQAPRRRLEAGQALADQPRPGVRANRKCATG
jgi:hypothetical protein